MTVRTARRRTAVSPVTNRVTVVRTGAAGRRVTGKLNRVVDRRVLVSSVIARHSVRTVTVVTVIDISGRRTVVRYVHTRDRRVRNVGQLKIVKVDDITFRMTIRAALGTRRPVTGVVRHHVTDVHTRINGTVVARKTRSVVDRRVLV